jgi:hypothetical protein
MSRLPYLLLLGTLLLRAADGSPLPPYIFFSDLDSGPNSGGEKNAGAYITIYGIRFGTTRGTSTVTVGGGAVASYPVWTDTKVTFQLGRLGVTGPIIVKTLAGTSNNDIVFTVRKNGTCGVLQDKECLYFVSARGNDGNRGSFAAPWATVPHAVQQAPEGGIIYTSVNQLGDDGQGWNSALTLRNTWCGARRDGYPRALVAYPGTTVTIGGVTGPDSGIRATDRTAGEGACAGHWTFAGLQLRGAGAALLLDGTSRTNPSVRWRIVGNDMTCPNGDGASACWHTSFSSDIKGYGNNVHDTGKIGPPTASALYHGVYFSTDSNQIDFGWNTISNTHGCRGLQIYSTNLDSQSGYDIHDVKIHDNVIHDTQCDGMVINTIDPSKGSIQIYNNVIYDAGNGPNNPELRGNWSCIYIAGDTNNGPRGTGAVQVDNNSLFDCGGFSKPPYWYSNSAIKLGWENRDLKIWIRNNILYQQAGVPYLICPLTRNCSGIYGSDNLFFGSGAAPSDPNLTNSISKDPLFIDLGKRDLHLSAGSPARSVGVETGLGNDKEGVDRSGASHCDLGAFQFVEQGREHSPRN